MSIRLSLQAVVLALVLSAPDALAQSSKTPDELLKGFLAAVQANSYEGMVAPLVAEGGEMAAALEKPEQKAANMLSREKLNRALAPRLAKGYAAISLGVLKYRGYQIYLWKLCLGSEGPPSASDSGGYVNPRAAGERRPV